MTRAQRRIVVALAGAAALVAVALGVAVATGRGDGSGKDGGRLAVAGSTTVAGADDDGSSATSPPGGGPSTTFALVPLTTGQPVPNAEEQPPPTQPPTATPAPAGAVPPRTTTTTLPQVTGQGAVLAPPPAGTPARPIDKAKGCNAAADGGWTVQECGALKTSGTTIVWVVEARGKGLRALVLQEQPAGSNQWALVLRAADDAGTAFSQIGVRGEDVSGDGQPELGFGFHRRDPAKTLSVDLVQVTTVAVHRDLPQGSARPTKGALDTWGASLNGDGSFDHTTIRYLDGAWRLAASERVDKASVPPSML